MDEGQGINWIGNKRINGLYGNWIRRTHLGYGTGRSTRWLTRRWTLTRMAICRKQNFDLRVYLSNESIIE